MAFSSTCKAGLTPHRDFHPSEVVWLPGDPGVTYTKGNLYTFVGGNGVPIAVTDTVGQGLLRCHKTTVCPANTVAFPSTYDGYIAHDTSQTNYGTLIPFEFMAPAQKIYAARIANYVDETVASYTSSTRAIAMTTGFGTDDYPNGALAVVYEGPGLGEINIVEDYDHAGGAAALLTIFHRPFTATLTTSSKLLVLNPAAAAQAVSFMDTMDAYDSNDLDVTDGVDNGDYILFPSWFDLMGMFTTGAVPVIRNPNHVWA